MIELLLIFISAALVNNFILIRFLGICPFIGVSRKIETALGLGIATTFVMTLSGIMAWFMQELILVPFNLPFMQYVFFILAISSIVQFVEMALRKMTPVLYEALGIFLPLITTNCAILGLALLIPLNQYGLTQSIFFAFGAGVGFTLAIVLMAGIRERLEFADVPEPLQGASITLITAGIMAMAFSGFLGLISV